MALAAVVELEVATVKVLQPFMPQLNGLLLN
ncbi:colicin-E1* [Escherichia coli B108]|nr:colicin-E1* [Escherichia coli B108]